MSHQATKERPKELFAAPKPRFKPRYHVIGSLRDGGKAVVWDTGFIVSLAEMSEAAEREFAGVPVEKLSVLNCPFGLHAQA